MLDTTLEYCMKNNIQPYLDTQSGIIEACRHDKLMETENIFMGTVIPHKRTMPKKG